MHNRHKVDVAVNIFLHKQEIRLGALYSSRHVLEDLEIRKV